MTLEPSLEPYSEPSSEPSTLKKTETIEDKKLVQVAITPKVEYQKTTENDSVVRQSNIGNDPIGSVAPLPDNTVRDELYKNRSSGKTDSQ